MLWRASSGATRWPPTGTTRGRHLLSAPDEDGTRACMEHPHTNGAFLWAQPFAFSAPGSEACHQLENRLLPPASTPGTSPAAASRSHSVGSRSFPPARRSTLGGTAPLRSGTA